MSSSQSWPFLNAAETSYRRRSRVTEAAAGAVRDRGGDGGTKSEKSADGQG